MHAYRFSRSDKARGSEQGTGAKLDAQNRVATASGAYRSEVAAGMLKELQADASTADLCRKNGLSDATFLQMVTPIWRHRGFCDKNDQGPNLPCALPIRGSNL
jgi:hypothetical protein